MLESADTCVVTSRLAVLTLCLFALYAAPSASADSVYPGTYVGKAAGVKAEVSVASSGEATLRYSLRTSCGMNRSRIELGEPQGSGFRGKRVSRGPKGSRRTTTARLRPAADGQGLEGTIRDALRGGNEKLDGCRSKKRFNAELERANDFIPARDVGHYAGSAETGLPLSFDLVADGSDRSRVTNLSADVESECYDESDEDSEMFTMIAHISGLEGKVASDGSVYIELTPDDETEYYAQGSVAGGDAEIEITIGGYFGADGNPDPASSVYCDNWGAIYEATRQP